MAILCYNYIMFIIIFFVFGAIFGSFINCLIYRLKNKKTILGRSFCPHCKHNLGFFDLFPIFSYLFLSCRCRYCKKTISFQYFFVEFIAGLVFAFGYYFYFVVHFSHLAVFNYTFYLVVSLFLIIIFIYDLKYYLILDEIIYPAIIFAFIFNLILGKNILNLLIAGIIGFLFFAIQYFFSRGKWVGGGDMFIGLFMGFVLGYPNILIAIFLSYILGTFVAIPLLLLKLKKISNNIPLGPFLTFATFLTLLFGDRILVLYLNLLY